MYGYFYLFTRAGIARLDNAYLEAAAALGAAPGRILRRVTLPLLRPALLGAALLTFMTSLSSFSAPYLFGGTFRVMTTQIVFSRLNGDNEMAMVETTTLAALALLGLFFLQRGEAPGRRGSDPRNAALARRRLRRGRSWPCSPGSSPRCSFCLTPRFARLLRAAGDLVDRGLASGVELLELGSRLFADGAPASDRELPLDGRRRDRGRARNRLFRGVAGRGTPQPLPRGARDAHFLALGAARDRLRRGDRGNFLAKRSLGGTLRARGHSSDSAARLSREEPAPHRARGFRRLRRSSLDEAGASLGARPCPRLLRITIPLLAPALPPELPGVS